MRHVITILFVLLPLAVNAGDDSTLAGVLEQLDIETSPDDLPLAPVPGFLEVSKGTKLLYISRNGRLLIDGDVIAVASATNLTEQRRAALRLDRVNRIPEQDRLVIPSAVAARERLIVFTDTNCPYCLKFHRQLDDYSRRGIEVHYLFYPRSGPAGESFAQAVAVWCATDRKAALEAVLDGTHLPAAKCDNPVLRHYELATELGLKGTPAVMTSDGAVRYGVPEMDRVAGHSRSDL